MTEDNNNPLNNAEATGMAMIDLAHIKVTDDQDAWALIAVPEEMYADYKQAIESGEEIDLYSYGEVLAYKIGAEKPTPEEEAILTEKFGYIPNLNLEKQIDNAIDDILDKL